MKISLYENMWSQGLWKRLPYWLEKESSWFLRKLRIVIPQDPDTPLFGIYLKILHHTAKTLVQLYSQ